MKEKVFMSGQIKVSGDQEFDDAERSFGSICKQNENK